MEGKPDPAVFARVLIAEDDAAQLRTLSAILRDEGFAVIACASAAEALREFAANEVDVAVVDLRLPDAAESELLDRMQEVAEAVPLIVNTGYSSYESARKAVNVGAFAYVEKGGDPVELVGHVRRAAQARLKRYAQALETAVAERTRQLQEALARVRQSERALLLRTRAIDAATQGITIVDPHRPGSPLVYVNRGFERMTGYRAGEMVGRHMAFLQGPGTDPETVGQMREAVRRGRDFQVEILNYRKDGTPFWNRVTGSPVRGESGEIEHYIGIHEDVTTLRETQCSLRQRESEMAHITRVVSMGEMATTLAHELNQPLQAIANYANGILRRVRRIPDVPPEFVDAAAEMAAESMRASEIIGRLRGFLRRREPRQSTVQVNEAVQEALQMLEYEALNWGVRVESRLAGDLPTLIVDSVQLQQVVVNLMRNAFAALAANEPGARTVVVQTRRSGTRCVEISVSDNGPGVAENLAERIFEGFFTTRPDGLGMGLAICRSIAEAAGGSICYEPNSPQGAVFRYRLPLPETA